MHDPIGDHVLISTALQRLRSLSRTSDYQRKKKLVSNSSPLYEFLFFDSVLYSFFLFDSTVIQPFASYQVLKDPPF